MAKDPGKPVAGRGARPRRQGPREELDKRIAKAAIAVFAREGWRRATLTGIAVEAGVGLAELYRHYGSKPAVLAGFVRMIDAEVLAGVDPDLAAEPARDRLFAVLMRRFDALRPYREGVKAVMAELPFDPPAAVAAIPKFLCSMAWMMEAANISTSGVIGAVRVQGLGLVWASTMRAWFSDDSPDMGATMAALDRALARAEGAAACLDRLARCCRGPRRADEGAGAQGAA